MVGYAIIAKNDGYPILQHESKTTKILITEFIHSFIQLIY